MARREKRAAVPPRCVLDSGGLTALTGRAHLARAWLRWIATHGGDVVVPTPVLVECITGNAARDAEANRILGVLARIGGALRPTDAETARLAGALRFAARSDDDGIDAIVAAEAAADARATVLLTSDPDDLSRLLADAPTVAIRRV